MTIPRKHEIFELHSHVPSKFKPLPAVIVTDQQGNEHTAVDQGYGFYADCDLSDESSKFLMENPRG